MFVSAITFVLGDVPNVTPNSNNPATQTLSRWLGAFEYIVLVLLVFNVIWQFWQLAHNHEKNGRGAVIGIVLSVIAIGFILGGTGGINRWAQFLSPT